MRLHRIRVKNISHYAKKDFFFKKSFSSPYGNRTRVSAVRGRRLNRLTNEPFIILPDGTVKVNRFFKFIFKIVTVQPAPFAKTPDGVLPLLRS